MRNEPDITEEDVHLWTESKIRRTSRFIIMAKIVQSLTRASPEYEESTFQSLSQGSGRCNYKIKYFVSRRS